MNALPPPTGWPPPVGPDQRRRHLRDALALLLVTPTVAEGVASFNTPGYLFPVVLPLLALIYGVPALLIRELWVRRRVGWPGFVLLSVAYGVFNEGLVAATWFKLSPDDEVLVFTAEQVGRAGGVNTALAVGLTLFHAVWSILVPIVLVESWSRTGRGRPWLPRWATIVSLIALTVVVVGSISNESMDRVCAASGSAVFDECVRGRRWSVVVIAALIVAALVTPKWRIGRGSSRVPGLRTLFGVGAAYYVAFLVAFFALPLNDRSGAAILLSVVLAAGAAAVVSVWVRAPEWGSRHAVVLASGALAPGMVASLLRVVVLQPVIALAFVALFLRPLWLRVGATLRH